MASVHQAGALAVLAASALLLLAASLAACRDAGHASVHRLALFLTAGYLVVALIGLLVLASGDGPHDGLHLLYGAVLVGAIPIGLTLASEAPDRARSGVLAMVAGVTLLLIWRLLSTG